MKIEIRPESVVIHTSSLDWRAVGRAVLPWMLGSFFGIAVARAWFHLVGPF